MRKFLVVTMSVVTMLMCAGCGSEEAKVNSGKFSMGTVAQSLEADSESTVDDTAIFEDSKEDIMFVPYITLDTEEKTFMLCVDSMDSYLPYGTYTIKDDVLTATTDDGLYTYKFKIVDKDCLEFIEKGSSDISYVDEGLSVNVEDGVVFGAAQ